MAKHKKHNPWPTRIAAVAALALAAQMGTLTSFADTVDSGANSLTVAAGESATVSVQLQAENGQSSNGSTDTLECNAGAEPGQAVTIALNVAGGMPSWLSVAPTRLTFTSCGVAQDVVVSVADSTDDQATAKLDLTASGGKADSVTVVQETYGNVRSPQYRTVTTTYTSLYRDDFVNVQVEDVVLPTDTDGDGVPDSTDNCDNTASTNQTDADEDGFGAPCDSNDGGATGSQPGSCPVASDLEPAPAITASNDPAASGWYNLTSNPTADPSFTLSEVVDQKQYKVDAGEWTDYVGAVTVATGVHTVTARSMSPASIASATMPACVAVYGTESSATMKVDRTAPSVVFTSASGTLGTAPWYTSDVIATFTASDATSGFADSTAVTGVSATKTGTGTTSGEGTAVTASSPAFTDIAGNTTAAGEATESFSVDKTRPALNITGATSGTAYDICAATGPTQPTFAPSDATSGIDETESVTYDSWTVPTTPSGVGTYTYAANAGDSAGWTSSETRTYTRTYGSAWSGVTQPINGGSTASFLDDNSRVKLGSTLPVKFKLACGTTPITSAVASLTVAKLDDAPDSGDLEALSTSAASTGNFFRYDVAAGHYIFNLNTKSNYTNKNGTNVAWSQGTYTLTVGLDDGSTRQVRIQTVR